MIHSVDSVRLAETIEKEAAKHNLTVKILVEVNVAGEESKFGLSPEEVLPFIEEISKVFAYSGLRIDDNCSFCRKSGRKQAIF